MCNVTLKCTIFHKSTSLVITVCIHYMCVYIYIHMNVCMCIYIYICIHTHTHVYICAYIHMHPHTHTHTQNIYILVYIHTHTHMRVIQKISSVCEYCRCSAAVTMVYMHAEIVDSVARHGWNLQTFQQCLCIVLCVYNV